MKYHQNIRLKNGLSCCLRNGTEEDGPAVWENFNLTHGESDFLLSYPDENSYDATQEGQFLKKQAESDREIELVAVVHQKIVGSAGIEAVGQKDKVRHRAEFGISIAKAYWGLGIGQALLTACIACARTAGYRQLELNVVADNDRAIAMYQKAGFVEYGRNPRGFCSRVSGFQEIIYMRLEL